MSFRKAGEGYVPSNPISSNVALNDIGQYAAAYTIGPVPQLMIVMYPQLIHIPSTATNISTYPGQKTQSLTPTTSFIDTHYPFLPLGTLKWRRVIYI
jgi:hypothetical protein